MDNLQIEKLVLREIEMPLKHAFETSFGVTTKRRVLIVETIDANGASGFGECTAMEQPLYNHESVDASWTVIKGTIRPILAGSNIKSAAGVAATLSLIRGNRMAIAAVETAIWDLEARLLNVPLWKHIGGTLSATNCGVSIGLQKTPEALVDKVAEELASGYQRIKIKIKPGRDVELVKAVRNRFPDILLSVDANSAYSLENDLELFRELDRYDLLMIEQPLEAGDLLDHAELQQQIRTPICLDESITCLRDARQALEIDACRIINIKLGRVGGHAEAKNIQELAASKNIPVWCGGMLETGIGRAHNIAMSTHQGFNLPGDISSSSRYWDRDVVTDPIVVSIAGTIDAPNKFGTGYDVDLDFLDSICTRTETLLLR